MQVTVKNIILYEPMGSVAGHCEIRTEGTKTHIKLKNNLNISGLVLSVVSGGHTDIIKITNEITEHDINRVIDNDCEVFVCLVRLNGEKPQIVASGAINLNKIKNKAVAEIDNVLRSACDTGGGNEQCDKCPYREYFFSETKTG